MAKQTINIGTVANDGTGDPLRTAFDKTNDNFNELYDGTAALTGTKTFDGDVAGYVETFWTASTLTDYATIYAEPGWASLDLVTDTSGLSPQASLAQTYISMVQTGGQNATNAPFILMARYGVGAPADLTANDVVGRIVFETLQNDGTGAHPTYELRVIYEGEGDNNAAISSLYFQTQNGDNDWRFDGDGGLVGYASSVEATSGSMGEGTLNCKGAYEDGVALGYKGIPQIAGSPSVIDATSVGKHIYANDNVTVNPGVFSAGDAVTIVNSSAGNITINEGSASPSQVTMYLAGTATTGNRTLAQKGIATILCVSSGASPLADVFIISGAGLT